MRCIDVYDFVDSAAIRGSIAATCRRAIRYSCDVPSRSDVQTKPSSPPKAKVVVQIDPGRLSFRQQLPRRAAVEREGGHRQRALIATLNLSDHACPPLTLTRAR